MTKKPTGKAELTGKVTKLMVQATVQVSNADGAVMSEGVGEPFALFPGQLVDFHALIQSMEKAINSKPDELAKLAAQGKAKA